MEQCLILSRNSKGTSAFEFLGRQLSEFGRWIKINNRLIEKDEQRRQNRQQNRPAGGRKYGPRR